MAAKSQILVVVIALLFSAAAGADGPPPWYAQPEQAGYHDCITHSCVLVPEVKQIKKTVYEVQEVPFCVRKLPPLWSLFHHHGCDDCEACPDCCPPRYKKVLVKKEVVCKEICTSKCVVEERVERVPCAPPCK